MSALRWMAFVAVAFTMLARTPVNAREAVSSADEPRGTTAVIESIVRSAALEDPVEIADRVERLEREIRDLIDRFGGKRPSYGRARRLHRTLHDEYLLQYDGKADHLWSIIEDQRFNCVSATLFHALVARGLGYAPEVLETPGHLLLRLRIGDRTVDVETTLASGFDVDLETYNGQPGGEAGTSGSLLGSRSERTFRSVALESAVGFGWLNAAWRAVERGDGPNAVRAATRARELLPEPISGSEGIRRLMVQAFRLEYEAGRFDSAYRIARMEAAEPGSSTTSRDRLLAAALKRIENACDLDDPAAGEAILGELAAGPLPEIDLARLELRACPLIAVAAVRIGDQALARRAVERYARVEPDPWEVARMRRWIDLRSRPAWAGAAEPGQCDGPLLGAGFLLQLD